MNLLEKIKKALNKVFKKTNEVKEDLNELTEKVEKFEEKLQEVNDFVEGFEIKKNLLDKYIDLFIETMKEHYAETNRVPDFETEDFTKVLNPVFKTISRKLKIKLSTKIGDITVDVELVYIFDLTSKGILSKKMGQYLRRKIVERVYSLRKK